MSQSNRIQSVDIGRGFAIFCMIAAHISVIFWVINDCGGILAAPVFLLISGISFEFFIESRIQKKAPTQNIFFESFSKSLFIYTLPLIPYILVCILFPIRFPFHLIHWGVFQVIAVGYIIGFFLHQNWKHQVIAIFLIFILTSAVQIYCNPMLGFLLSDYTPILPWLAYFILGQLIYRVYSITPLNSSKLLMISSIAFISGLAIFKLSNLPLDSNFRGQIPVFILISSFFFFIQSIFIILVDRFHKCDLVLNPFERIGKIAFSAYYLQYPLIFCAAYIITKYSLPTVSIIPFILVIICILAMIETYWEKYNYRFGFEWIMRTGSAKLTKLLILSCNRLKIVKI